MKWKEPLTPSAPQRRRAGAVEYTLVRKQVKRLNLRVDAGGAVTVSAPVRVAAAQVDAFVESRTDWILRTREKLSGQIPVEELPHLDRGQCLAYLSAALERVYPLVEGAGVKYPQLRLRRMRSQWGNCHWKEGYVTLNTALAACPEGLADYVALHELCHFLHPDHSPAFHQAMTERMPDWKARRRELRKYAGALGIL